MNQETRPPTPGDVMSWLLEQREKVAANFASYVHKMTRTYTDEELVTCEANFREMFEGIFPDQGAALVEEGFQRIRATRKAQE